jgi:hypothetical protein
MHLGDWGTYDGCDIENELFFTHELEHYYSLDQFNQVVGFEGIEVREDIPPYLGDSCAVDLDWC